MFCDPNVYYPVGEGVGQGLQSDGSHHGCGYAQDFRVFFGSLEEFLSANRCPPEPALSYGEPGFGVDLADCVEAIRQIFLGRRIASPFLRYDVDQDGGAVGLSVL